MHQSTPAMFNQLKSSVVVNNYISNERRRRREKKLETTNNSCVHFLFLDDILVENQLIHFIRLIELTMTMRFSLSYLVVVQISLSPGPRHSSFILRKQISPRRQSLIRWNDNHWCTERRILPRTKKSRCRQNGERRAKRRTCLFSFEQETCCVVND